MKKIEAIIGPECVERVRGVLEDQRISNFLFTDVVAKSAGPGRQYLYRGHAYNVEFHSEVKVEAVVREDQVTTTAYALLRAAGGRGASCKPRVLLTPVNEVILDLDELGPQPNGVKTNEADSRIRTAS